MDNDSLVEFFKDTCEVTSNKNDIYNMKELYTLFKNGSYYSSLDKEQKRTWGYNHFTEQVKNNNFIKRFYKERLKLNGKTLRRVLQGIKIKEQEENNKLLDY